MIENVMFSTKLNIPTQKNVLKVSLFYNFY